MVIGDWAEDEDGNAIPQGPGAPPQRVNGHDTPDDPTLVQWARFRDQFAELMDDGYWTLDDLEYRIASHRAFFFPGREAALVGQIDVYPGGQRAFRILWAVGDPAEGAVILPGIEALARMMGCTSMLFESDTMQVVPEYQLWSMVLRKAL